MSARCCRIFFLIVSLIVNALDFISDWLFYVSAEKVEKGLVYGPVDPHQVTALLVFSIVGSVGFVVEIAIFIFELRKGEDHHGDLLLDLVSAIIIWVEDIPQVVISFSIALCREEAVSIFQLTKAGLVLVGVIIHIIATIVRFCRNFESKKQICGVRLCLMLGIFTEGAFAAAIFYLTQTEPDGNGQPSFRVPTTIMDEHLSDSRYLTDVSTFLHNSDLFDSWYLDTNKKDASINWLRLFSLDRLKDENHLSFKLNYEHVGIQMINMALWIATSLQSTSAIKWSLSECYSINHQTAEVAFLSNTTCTDSSFVNNNTETFFIDFRFEEPDKGFFYRKRMFGEVFFNVKVLKDGICSDGNFEDPHRNGATLFYPLSFHYFRVDPLQSANDVKHLYVDSSNVTRFYRKNSEDMTDVAQIWKTGWSECSSTGSVSPVWDRDMQMRCN
uniref:Uncharacterized protein n=1 Tax=Arion vulgaris TaxID=1028688 RepID=A0A0B6YUH2_9EUPU